MYVWQLDLSQSVYLVAAKRGDITIPSTCLRFIHALDCGWITHPFLRNRFKLTHDDEIRKIVAAGIRTVTIDCAQAWMPTMRRPSWKPPRSGPKSLPSAACCTIRAKP